MEEKRYVGTARICQELGISRKTLYKLLREGKIPHIRVGSGYKFNIDEVVSLFRVEVKDEDGK